MHLFKQKVHHRRCDGLHRAAELNLDVAYGYGDVNVIFSLAHYYFVCKTNGGLYIEFVRLQRLALLALLSLIEYVGYSKQYSRQCNAYRCIAKVYVNCSARKFADGAASSKEDTVPSRMYNH